MRIGALIPVRMASERLPRKAMLDLVGRPVIHHLLDRVRAARHISDDKDVVVCTTTDPEDDPLVEAVEAEGCSVFRGARDDIVKRFGDAFDAFGFDAVIQADGDDPLSATEYMDSTMDHLLAHAEIDIVTVAGLPLGCATKSFTRRAMDRVLAAYATEKNDTGFIYYFTKGGVCQHDEIVSGNPAHAHATARLTLDYPVDLEVFRAVFEALYSPGKVFGLTEVVEFLLAHPEVVERNRTVEAQYWRRTAEKATLRVRDADGRMSTIG